ncbi:MAG TPA: hypothetical protein VKB86_07845 [Pyrinomonadaceae bacterium]|nr:hypothetical protein [Pyrinomonadaceae bacterium]
MMSFTSSESRQSESTKEKRADVDRAWPEEMRTVSEKEKRSRQLLWIVILILALVALILTIIFGYYSLGSSDTIRR